MKRKKTNSPLTTQRVQAQIGMSAALGTLVATGFMARSNGSWTKNMRNIHLWAGVAMVGFSYWHWTLYQKNNSTKG